MFIPSSVARRVWCLAQSLGGGHAALGVTVLVGLLALGCSRGAPSSTAPSASQPASPAAPAPQEPTRAPSPTPTPTPGPKPAAIGKVGERVESSGIALTVNTNERTETLGRLFKASAGKIYVVIDVTVENGTREKAPYNPFYFKVKDSDGYEYSMAIGADKQLGSGELAAGEKARGTVAFEVPAAAKGLVVSYQPLVLLGGFQAIRVSLE